MTVKATLSLSDRHHQFLVEQVGRGVFASQSAAVAAALDQMIRDEETRDMALDAVTEETRSRLETPRSDYVAGDDAFAATRARLRAARKA